MQWTSNVVQSEIPYGRVIFWYGEANDLKKFSRYSIIFDVRYQLVFKICNMPQIHHWNRSHGVLSLVFMLHPQLKEDFHLGMVVLKTWLNVWRTGALLSSMLFRLKCTQQLSIFNNFVIIPNDFLSKLPCANSRKFCKFFKLIGDGILLIVLLFSLFNMFILFWLFSQCLWMLSLYLVLTK